MTKRTMGYWMVFVTYICFMGMICFSIYWQHETTFELKLLRESLVNEGLYDPDNEEKLVNGVYYSNRGYYCVQTSGRSWDEARMTDYHEMCHHFIENVDKNHFCEDQNQTNWEYWG